MRIFVLGTRGVPGIPGGVETHCQNLYPRVAKRGHEVTVARRTGYVTEKKKNWEGVDLVDIYSPRLKSAEALVHTFLGIFRARLRNEKLIHIHGIASLLLVGCGHRSQIEPVRHNAPWPLGRVRALRHAGLGIALEVLALEKKSAHSSICFVLSEGG